MNTDVLQRFRDVLAAGHTSMNTIAKVSGIPITTLSYMKKSGWGDGMVDKLDKLSRALDEIERGEADKPSQQGGTPTAA